MRARLLVCSLVVAVIGLSSAGLIYLTVDPETDSAEGVQIVIVDGQTYRIPLSDTKIYRRELQRIGGNAAVLVDEFHRWFVGLWHGRSLAITLAWITAAISVGLLVLARQIGPDADDRGDGQAGG